jgi:hypothetical protein
MDPILDEEVPPARLVLLLQHFSYLEDGRELVSPRRGPLALTCATIASGADFKDILGWGEHHLDFPRRFSAR